MTGWTDLDAELDAWGKAGGKAPLWWRDDDATRPTPALDRLLALQAKHRAPLALAVIPARAEPALAERLAGIAGVCAFQHGWAHMNHAPPGRSKAELGPERPTAYVLGELARGAIALDRVFGERGWRRALVPPHNRITPDLRAALPAAGWRGLSAGLGPRGAPVPGLAEVNAHVDIMDWSTRGFGGEGPALATLVVALAARRTGAADAAEPVGLLTHHLAHDEPAWAFTGALLARLAAHPSVAFADGAELLA